MRELLAATCVVLFLTFASAAKFRPLVLMHGLTANKSAMSSVELWARQDFPGIYVHNADIPTQNTTRGNIDSLLIPMNDQVEILAAQLAADPNLAGGFDMVCHSQGGLLCRGFIERYNSPRAHNFISLAGPQAGVFGVPKINALCPDVECPWLAEWMNKASEGGGWLEPIFQNSITFAQYWKNPLNYTEYLKASAYLADINNERAVKNPLYKQNLLNITGNITLVMALLDEIVVPKESTWFDFYALGQDTVLQNMTQSDQYKEDWLGLRTLNEAGRLERLAVECGHCNLPRAPCKSVVYDAVIKPRIGGLV